MRRGVINFYEDIPLSIIFQLPLYVQLKCLFTQDYAIFTFELHATAINPQTDLEETTIPMLSTADGIGDKLTEEEFGLTRGF
jgi:hypothetical protein